MSSECWKALISDCYVSAGDLDVQNKGLKLSRHPHRLAKYSKNLYKQKNYFRRKMMAENDEWIRNKGMKI